MFGWRKRSEGFEWREYVRTTVLVRRADRQRRIDDVRLEALAKITDVRDRGMEAGKSSAHAVWGQIKDVLQSLLDVFIAIASALGLALWGMLKTAASGVRDLFARLPIPSITLPKLTRPAVRFPQSDKRRDTALPDAPRQGRLALALPRLPVLPEYGIFSLRNLGIAATCVALAIGLGPMLQGGGGVSVAEFVPHVSAFTPNSTITGRASAVTGALLRVNGELIELSGIEAPDPQHPCLKANGKRWPCGASAITALNGIVRGAQVTCVISSHNALGRANGACRVDDRDIAAKLVRNGYVFAASSGLFSTYAGDEAEAQSQKLGLWQGETVRPQEWRERAWEEAKRVAPDGCPIKGFIRASERFYAMPWSRDYQSGKVRQAKGERWFCSEDDARAAGFKLSSRS